jgi:hypothetical protein
MSPKTRLFTAALFLTLFSAGCDNGRLAQFGGFAAAGTAYVTAFHAFTQEVGTAFITADSASSIVAREAAGDQNLKLHAADYRKQIEADDLSLKTYLTTLQTLDEQASLLASFFAAITALTDGKASTATVTSLNGLVDSINTVNPAIEKASFGGQSVKSFLGSVAAPTVAHFEVRALDENLKKWSPVLDKALALQEASVAAMTAQLQDSLKASLQVQETNSVLTPYVTPGPLPGSWAANREAYLRQNVVLQSADSAKKAVATLHADFRILVADKNSKIDFSVLTQEIGKMSGFTAAVKSSL